MQQESLGSGFQSQFRHSQFPCDLGQECDISEYCMITYNMGFIIVPMSETMVILSDIRSNEQCFIVKFICVIF